MLNNKKVYDLSLQLKEELLNLPLIKEYNSLAKQVSENKYLSDFETKLKAMQKKLVHLLDNNEQEEYEVVLKEYLNAKKEYDNHPLYSNYMTLKEEVNDLLQNIANLISVK